MLLCSPTMVMAWTPIYDTAAASQPPSPSVLDSSDAAEPIAPATPIAAVEGPAPIGWRGGSEAHTPDPGVLHVWTILLDFADLDGGGRRNQRHFAWRDSSSNLCCLDLSWTPWRSEAGLFLGSTLDIGHVKQKLSDATDVGLTDLLVAGSLGWHPGGFGPWIRGDLGIATLVVARRSVGSDWGVGGSLRAGWIFSVGRWALLAGGGGDWRAYANLDVEDVPAVTIFAGVEL